MAQTFEQFLRKNALLNPNKRILLAVSGGVDSIVLFHLFQRIDQDKRPKLAIAHVNHQLRPESDSEEVFVRNLAKKYGVPFYSYTWLQSKHPTSGIEEAGREMRYTFFEEVMAENKLDVLMTGHHQGDQVETILMKLTRGSSLKQLTGIKSIQPFGDGLLVRPLLSFSKEDLYNFAHENQLQYVEDKTNQQLTHSRNRFRNQIIPLLKEENIQFNSHIEQFAKDLTDLISLAEPAISRTFQEFVLIEEGSISFNSVAFFDLEEAMQRAVLQQVFEVLYTDSKVSYKANYIDIVREWLLAGAVNTTLDLLGGFVAEKAYETVKFYERAIDDVTLQNESYLIEGLNQWVQLSEKEAIGLFDEEGGEGTDCLHLAADSVEFPLTVRHRQPGDRMTYAGLDGRKKIKDILIDEKVPLTDRDRAWLVEDAKGQIVWLIGYRKMRLLSVTETDKLTYILKYKKLNT